MRLARLRSSRSGVIALLLPPGPAPRTRRRSRRSACRSAPARRRRDPAEWRGSGEPASAGSTAASRPRANPASTEPAMKPTGFWRPNERRPSSISPGDRPSTARTRLSSPPAACCTMSPAKPSCLPESSLLAALSASEKAVRPAVASSFMLSASAPSRSAAWSLRSRACAATASLASPYRLGERLALVLQPAAGVGEVSPQRRWYAPVGLVV